METLTRIYSLKTEGLEKVLSDINQIKEAFKGSGAFTNEMAGASTNLGTSLSAATAQIAKMQLQIDAMVKAEKESAAAAYAAGAAAAAAGNESERAAGKRTKGIKDTGQSTEALQLLSAMCRTDLKY